MCTRSFINADDEKATADVSGYAVAAVAIGANRAIELYLDLFEFAEKYRDHLLLAKMRDGVTRST